ncbi:UbiA family prenyltransferase [Leucobacter sp. W1153]|uniref:UbiA family prenyltransferase n=1 Tax=Leucobacter sp. W1153 TaxID=3439064 RepID=UPI003F2C969B
MRTVALLWKSTHPGPTLVVTAIVLGMGLSVGLDPARLLLLIASVFFGQVSIGLSNDAIDASRDRAVGRSDKPLAQEDAPVSLAWAVAAGTLVLALVLAALLTWQVALAHFVFLAAAWAYNLGLKATPWSALCFVVGFGAVPALAPLSLPDPMLPPLWATAVGAAFGIAIHFSNVLPDLDDDRATGVRGLPHRMGRVASAVVAPAALVVGAGIVAMSVTGSAAIGGPGSQPGEVPSPRLVVLPWIGFAAVAVVAVAALGVSLRGRATRLGFRLVMLAALLLVAQLIVTGGLAG